MTTEERKPTRRTRRLLLAVATLLTALALIPLSEALLILFSGARPDQGFQTVPEGFWHRDVRSELKRGSDRSTAEERARLLSLPYLGQGAPAGEGDPYGVVFHEPSRTSPGYNLYTSGHAPEAILMDMEGRPIHSWSSPFPTTFPEIRPTQETSYLRRSRLLADGTLVGLYQTGGLAFLDPASRKRAGCSGNFYNDFWIDEEHGTIWTIAKEARRKASGEEVLDDSIVQLRFDIAGGSCEETRRIPIVPAFRRSPFSDTLDPMAAMGDRLHSNAIVELPASSATTAAGFTPGHLLISLREVDVIAVIDPEAETVTWAQRGPWKAQHDPSLLPNGDLLVFDNQGGPDGSSRLLTLDPPTGRVLWSWPDSSGTTFRSSIAGTSARLPNGNTLVTESVTGRAFELDPGGQVVWEFRTPHRAGPNDELVAMLFEMKRLAPEAAEWFQGR